MQLQNEEQDDPLLLLPPIFVALDVPSAAQADQIVNVLGDAGTHYKVGLQLFLAAGRPYVESLLQRGKRIFLDLKFHDIPNTVGKAVEEAAKLGVDLCTVHSLAGSEALRRAVEAAARYSGEGNAKDAMGVLAVTLLTSVTPATTAEIGMRSAPVVELVQQLTHVAERTGARGVVCAASELAALKLAHPGLRALVPGIRPAGAESHDQARVATPGEAVRLGADYLVIGRPIIEAPDSQETLLSIRNEVRMAVEQRNKPQ